MQSKIKLLTQNDNAKTQEIHTDCAIKQNNGSDTHNLKKLPRKSNSKLN